MIVLPIHDCLDNVLNCYEILLLLLFLLSFVYVSFRRRERVGPAVVTLTLVEVALGLVCQQLWQRDRFVTRLELVSHSDELHLAHVRSVVRVVHIYFDIADHAWLYL